MFQDRQLNPYTFSFNELEYRFFRSILSIFPKVELAARWKERLAYVFEGAFEVFGPSKTTVMGLLVVKNDDMLSCFRTKKRV